MTRRIGGAQAVATRPISALISAALLLITMVAGGVGGFATLGQISAKPITTGATTTVAASIITVPMSVAVAAGSRSAVPMVGDRRGAPALRLSGSRQRLAGWAPQNPEAADVPATGWQPPTLVDLPVEAEPTVIALTIRVSHRGRAPPAGSLRR